MATIKDLAKVIVSKHQLRQRDAEVFVNAVVETIIEGLQNDRLVKIKGFGTFKLTAVRDRESVNVNTGERVVISGHDKISFTPDAVMKDVINKPFAQFDTVILSDEVKFEEEPEGEEYTFVESSGHNQSETMEDTFVASSEQSQPEVVEDTTVESFENSHPETVGETSMKKNELDVSEDIEKLSVEKTIKLQHVIPSVETDSVVDIPVLGLSEVDETDKPKGENLRMQVVDEEIDKPKTVRKKTVMIYSLLINIIVAALFFVLGYFTSSRHLLCSIPEQKEAISPVIVDTLDALEDTIPEPVALIDMINEKKKDSENDNDSVSLSVKSEQKQDVVLPENKSSGRSVDNVPDQSVYYNDARVRTGAYVIVGTTTTVTVRKGQTLKSISKAYLGEGMECYVEAYNGSITEVKEGQTLKIPKLQLKKKL